MQRIERYGVIALVFLLVTIVAVSLWGEQKKSDGFFSFLKRDSKSAQVDRLIANASQERASAGTPITVRDPLDRTLPLSSGDDPESTRRAFAGPQAAPEELNDYSLDERGGILPGPTLPDTVPSPADPRPLGADPSARESASVAQGSRTYTIRASDTLSEIAQRELGTHSRWRELVAANPGLDAARLKVGTTIQIPAGKTDRPGASVARRETALPPTQPKAVPAPAPPGRNYTIRGGDTLSAIAQRELGSESRWREIAAANPSLNPDKLMVGTQIRLPAGAVVGTNSVASAKPSAGSSKKTGSKVR
jgi:LysM repeat protein